MSTEEMLDRVERFNKATSELNEDLIEFLKTDSTVFISPHLNLDFDALSSAASLYEICKILGKKAYIVIDDDEDEMRINDPKMFIMLQDVKNYCNIISVDEMNNIRTVDTADEDRLIVVDTNNINRVQVRDAVATFKHTMVIDHHSISATPVEAEYNYVIPEATSASEIVAELFILNNFDLSERISGDLLTGIWLDTSRLTNATVSSKTASILSVLLQNGANIMKSERMFTVPLEDMQKEQELFDSAKHESFNYSIAYNEREVYKDTSLSRVVERLKKLDRDVVFAVGYEEVREKGKEPRRVVAIKARSNDRGANTVDVDAIMKNFGGGGDMMRAAAIVETDNILSVVEAIGKTLKPGLSIIDTNEAQEKVYEYIKSRRKR